MTEKKKKKKKKKPWYFIFQNIEYSVDLRARNCTVREPHPRTWFPFGVPPDARFAGEGTIGAVGTPGEGVTLAFFEGEFEGQGESQVRQMSLKLEFRPLFTSLGAKQSTTVIH